MTWLFNIAYDRKRKEEKEIGREGGREEVRKMKREFLFQSLKDLAQKF